MPSRAARQSSSSDTLIQPHVEYPRSAAKFVLFFRFSLQALRRSQFITLSRWTAAERRTMETFIENAFSKNKPAQKPQFTE
jgi:hypothetical protein